MKLLYSTQIKLIFTFLLIIISASNTTSLDRYVDLKIGVDVGDSFEFKINNFEDQSYNIDMFLFEYDYNPGNFELLNEDTFTITIDRIETESSEYVCFVDGDDCIYYTPEIYVELNSGSSNITGIINLSATPFGELISTTDWELVESNILNPSEAPDDFLEINKEDLSFNRDGNNIIIGLDVNATFIIPSNEDFQFPYQSLAIEGTSIYDAETGVLQSNYEEISFSYINGTLTTEILDITNTGYNQDSDDTLSLPIFTFNQTIFFLFTSSLIYYYKRKKQPARLLV